jgi:hypothetical protein
MFSTANAVIVGMGRGKKKSPISISLVAFAVVPHVKTPSAGEPPSMA